MFEVRQIETAPGLVFDVSVGGPDDGAPVLMLHGFCVSRHYYTAQVEALAAAGYRAIAPNQRGYAAGARPDPKDLDAYRMELLIRDALDIVEAAGHGAPRFHLVGHDWGGSLSWGHRRPLARAGCLAHHALAPAPPRFSPRPCDARRRAGKTLQPP